MNEANEGLFLSPEDVKVLFTLLKSREYALSNVERQLLLKIETALYACLSIDEAEALLPRSQIEAADPCSGRKGG
ncbi:MAG: hypothetical protein LBB83_09500 [Treponema sp.]|jgi:hypothetical protein|nr:hypothetical protein [Treponema sp.]